MPERVNSFAPMIPGVFSVLVATIAVLSYTPARADSACIEQPNQPAAEGMRWSSRYDRAKGRKCWFLVDASANGHEAPAPQAQQNAASAPSISSQISSFIGSITGASANVTPQGGAPQSSSPPAGPASGPRKPQGNAANASRADGAARADLKSGDGHPAKRVSSGLTQPEREALFEEFLRWHENQEGVSSIIPSPASR